MKMKPIILILFLFSLVSISFPQKYLERNLKGYTKPDELVTMSASLPFNQAVELLNKISELATGKRVVSTVERANPIGIEIKNMPYDKALTIIVQYANLMYEEKEDVIVIKKKSEIEQERTKDNYADVNSREVKISAVFFEMDTEESRERGIDWKILLGKRGLDIGGELTSSASSSASSTTGQEIKTPGAEFSASSEFDIGGFFGEATSVFKFLETENLGEVIASPNIIVRDRQAGRIQVGSDFSVKQRDFAGNIIDIFFSTGSIIQVTPYIYREDGINYILLNLNVERSSGFPGELSTEIKKTTANTQVLMLDGEQTVIGGLFTNEDQTERRGIPILKDLPWWVLGIRYLTGYDKVTTRKKELIILIKADLVPSLKDRIAGQDVENPIKQEVLKNREKIKYYQFNQKSKEN